jgi:hypothetical protein
MFCIGDEVRKDKHYFVHKNTWAGGDKPRPYEDVVNNF